MEVEEGDRDGGDAGNRSRREAESCGENDERLSDSEDSVVEEDRGDKSSSSST